MKKRIRLGIGAVMGAALTLVQIGSAIAVGALLLGVCAALLAWRMLVGTVGLEESGETSMLLVRFTG